MIQVFEKDKWAETVIVDCRICRIVDSGDLRNFCLSLSNHHNVDASHRTRCVLKTRHNVNRSLGFRCQFRPSQNFKLGIF